MFSVVGSLLYIGLILAHLQEGPEPVFGVITLIHILFQKKPTKNCTEG